MKNYKTPSTAPSTLNEPLAPYGSANYFELANQAMSKNYIKEILSITRLSLAELMEIIPISIDTYKRKKEFGPAVTEKILELEEVYRKGLEVFEGGFYSWMDAKNAALGNIKPKKLLVNSFGVRRLLDELGRIEHGVLA
ncbi:MAG: antitoxin Xre/MbcA/ParS toxin-binding domain-containing protein [Bacteroidota bacterium]